MKMPTALDEHFSGTNALFMAVPGLVDMVTGLGPASPVSSLFAVKIVDKRPKMAGGLKFDSALLNRLLYDRRQ